jgi:acyl-ACP thioesterase
MSENNKIGKYKYTVEPFHVDFTGHLTMGILGNTMLNCACSHSTDRGFGITTINKENYTWVISRLAVEIDEMPYKYETFELETWVENVYRLFTDRNFAIINKDGVRVGYARSVWAMINVSTRKPVNLLQLHDGEIANYVCDAPCPIAKPSRITLADDGKIVSSMTAKYSDIDVNNHVNSIRYIEHVLDLFPVELYRTKHLRRFEIAYVAESCYGDRLDFILSEDKSDMLHKVYNIEIKKNGQEIVCRSKAVFQ